MFRWFAVPVNRMRRIYIMSIKRENSFRFTEENQVDSSNKLPLTFSFDISLQLVESVE